MSSSCEHEHETSVTVISAGQAQFGIDGDRTCSHVLSSAGERRISCNDGDDCVKRFTKVVSTQA